MRVFTAAPCLEHPGFPEQPQRLATVLDTLHADGRFVPHEAEPADLTDLTAVHPASYLEHLQRAAEQSLDAGEECPLVPTSWPAILAATGATLVALDAALAHTSHAFAAVRPPGHHAAASRAAGFCAVNHIACAAAVAHQRGLGRALIIDWDVHHGDGTQALVAEDPRTRFVSMHQYPWYPGTGSAAERGSGNCFNLPMHPGLPRAAYVETLWQGVTHATRGWDPELILLSAGYDSLAGDPLGGFTLEPADMATWVHRLRERWPSVPIVGVMEGGYLPTRLAEGVLATVEALA